MWTRPQNPPDDTCARRHALKSRMEGLLDVESPKLSKEELQQRAIKYEQVPTDVVNGEYMINFDLTDHQVLVSKHTQRNKFADCSKWDAC